MRLSILLALVITSVVVNAQDSLKIKQVKPSRFGVKAGANLSNLFVDNVAGEKPKIGYLVGLYYKIPFSDKVTFIPEFNYTNTGARIKYNNNVQGNGEYSFGLNYIQIPALIEVRLNKTVSIHAGPYVSFLSNVVVKRIDTDNNAVSSITNLRTDDFNKTELGVAGGIGFDVNKYNIGLRYNYGFNQVGKEGNASDNDTKNSRNYVVNLYIAFGF